MSAEIPKEAGMNLSLNEEEVKILRACLEEGSKLMMRLLMSPHADASIKQKAKRDSLIIGCIRNKINRKEQK